MAKNGNDLLAPFLRHLAEQIEKNTLSQDNLERIGDFFRSYLFENEVNDEFSEEEFRKFVILGWWIYHNLKIEI